MTASKKNFRKNTPPENTTGSKLSVSDAKVIPHIHNDKSNIVVDDKRYISTPAAVTTGAVIGVIISLLLFYPLLGVEDPNAYLWSDDFDGQLLYWIFNWGYHAISTGKWSSFFDANIFHPHPNTFAYSDSLLAAQLFYTPLRALGVAPVSAIHLTLILVVLCGCILTAIAAKNLGIDSKLAIATLVFCASAFA